MKTRNIKNKTYCLVLLTLSFLLTAGMKCKKDIFDPNNNQLPAITQEGKNTFGFLLNGEVWVPKAPILRSKLDLSYDPGYMGGTFNIVAFQYNGDFFQQLSIGNKNINKIGEYPLLVNYYNGNTQCSYDVNQGQPVGKIIITKLDLTGNGIISGTFNFKLEKEGCPTINATEGRFDMSIQ